VLDGLIVACAGTVPRYEAKCIAREMEGRKITMVELAEIAGCHVNKRCEYEYSFWIEVTFGAFEKKSWQSWRLSFDPKKSPDDISLMVASHSDPEQ
jgi:hypothetical protein